SDEGELESVAPHDAWTPENRDVSRGEDRRRISNAERLEMSQRRFEIESFLIELDLGVDAQLRYELVERQTPAHDFVETTRERFDLVAGDRDSGSRSVAAESEQQIRALRECRVKIESRNR